MQVVFHGIEARREVFLDGARGNAKLHVRCAEPVHATCTMSKRPCRGTSREMLKVATGRSAKNSLVVRAGVLNLVQHMLESSETPRNPKDTPNALLLAVRPSGRRSWRPPRS